MIKYKLKYYIRYLSFIITKNIELNEKIKRKLYGGYQTIFEGNKLKSIINIDKTNQKPLKVAIVTLGGTAGMYLDFFLALVLQARGHKVVFYLEDSCMPLFEIHDFENEKSWKGASKRSYFLSKKMLEYSNFEFNKFSDIISKGNNINIDVYKDILEASLLRHYRVGKLDNNLIDFEKRKELYKKTIKISHQVGKDIVNKRFDRVIMNHGLYSSTGPCRKVIQDAEIPVLTHDAAKRKDCFNFTWNQSSDKWDVSRPWEKLKNKELTKSEKTKIDNYIKSRIKHSDDRLVYNFGEYIKPEELIKKLNLDPDKPIYTLFTNVLWDAASSQREIVFSNPVEWVIETINWFNNHPEKQLILKIHPAEVVIGTKQPFYDIIINNVQVPKNVTIIRPETIINSWSVIEATDLGIVHTTTAGMELPLVGVPCCVVSNTHYRNKGFTIDVDSKEKYFELLSNFEKGMKVSEKEMKIAKRYAHLLFEKYQYKIPFLIEPERFKIIGYNLTHNINLVAENIVKRIENQEDFLNP